MNNALSQDTDMNRSLDLFSEIKTNDSITLLSSSDNNR